MSLYRTTRVTSKNDVKNRRDGSQHLRIILFIYKESYEPTYLEGGGGKVVKLLACGARGPEFDSRSRHYDFRDW